MEATTGRDLEQGAGRQWRALQHRWWLLVASVVVAAAAAVVVSRSMTPVYQASAKVLVQRGQTLGVPEYSDIQATERLAETYRDLVRTRPVLGAVIAQLSLSQSPNELAETLGVKATRSIITIRADSSDPQLAADIANTTAQLFIERILQQQLEEIDRLQTALSQYGLADNFTIISARAASMSTLTIAEDAVVPGSPARPLTWLNVLLASLLGLLAGAGVLFLLEYLDDSVRSADEFRELTGLPVLGAVQRHHKTNGAFPQLVSDTSARSALVESYKFLQANLEFAAVGGQLKSIMVTSCGPGEGKTFTSANLASIFARGGRKVLLVDADLRSPTLGRLFEPHTVKGLTNLLVGDAEVDEVLPPPEGPGVQVLFSGPIPPDPTLLLKSSRMQEVAAALKERVDLVIYDCPPVLAVVDPLLMASLVDGVLVVVDLTAAGRTGLKRGMEILQPVSSKLLGAVFNKVPTTGRGGYYYYYPYYYYYGTDGRARATAASAARQALSSARHAFGRGVGTLRLALGLPTRQHRSSKRRSRGRRPSPPPADS